MKMPPEEIATPPDWSVRAVLMTLSFPQAELKEAVH